MDHAGIEEVIKKLLAEEVEEEGDDADDDDGSGDDDGGGVAIPDEMLEERGDRAAIQELAGKPAPALQVSNWMNTEPLDLADLQGKVVMLDFWGTW
jgi:hypothetical protein